MNIETSELIQKINQRIDEITSEEYLQNKKLNDEDLLTINGNEDSIEFIYKKYMDKLDNLVGLDEVKTEIKKLIDYLIFLNKTKDLVSLDNINLNMVFRGNPGTGKTTVARIVSTLLYKLGFLKSNIVIETTPRDFIAGYIGQTAIKARSTIDRALHGVIFIDEAYSFCRSKDEGSNTFAYEALTEIIKEMEKKDTVFIFAGYSKEMDKFIKINPGIKSRIGYDIIFKDYTKEELLTMFYRKVKKSGMKLDINTKKILLEKIEDNMTKKDFGNGRMIDNLFDEVMKEHAATNLYEKDKNKLLLITKDDINNIKIQKEGGMCFEWLFW